MIDSSVEKRSIERILTIWKYFIKELNSIDILYSEKIGYLLISIEHNQVEFINEIRSSEQLLRLLIDEFISVIVSSSSDHIEEILSESEKAQCGKQLSDMLIGTSETERATHMQMLEKRFETFY